jgi:hypothetical protein
MFLGTIGGTTTVSTAGGLTSPTGFFGSGVSAGFSQAVTNSIAVIITKKNPRFFIFLCLKVQHLFPFSLYHVVDKLTLFILK